MCCRVSWRGTQNSCDSFEAASKASSTVVMTYVELLSRRETLAATLPLADKLVARGVDDRSRSRDCLLRSALGLLWGVGSSDSRLSGGLFSAHGCGRRRGHSWRWSFKSKEGVKSTERQLWSAQLQENISVGAQGGRRVLGLYCSVM
jgi:hypothetical protein